MRTQRLTHWATHLGNEFSVKRRNSSGIRDFSGLLRFRPACVSSQGVRVIADVILNDENPGTGHGPRGLERGNASLGDTWKGGDREMKTTRVCGTTRAARPFHHRDHAIGCAFAYADTGLGIKGVGVT